jgi:hypothetical protein
MVNLPAPTEEVPSPNMPMNAPSMNSAQSGGRRKGRKTHRKSHKGRKGRKSQKQRQSRRH